jgi:hypothetical protein
VRQNLAMPSSDPSSDGGEREVLAGLPNARPHRRSAKRDRPVRAADTPAKTKPRAKSKPAAKASAKPKPRAKPARPAAAPRAAGPRAAAPRATASKIPPAGYATPRDDDALKGADLVTTAVQAAGELAQIGIAASGRALKSALHRLPRP